MTLHLSKKACVHRLKQPHLQAVADVGTGILLRWVLCYYIQVDRPLANKRIMPEQFRMSLADTYLIFPSTLMFCAKNDSGEIENTV